LPVAECVRLGVELGEALSYLHSRQLVHRDIKPANIIFVNDLPKLADVGLVTHFAEAKRDDKKLGTEGFVPPEGPGTPTADVYSLGKVLCEASLGLAAATSASPPEVPAHRAQERGLSELIAIIRRACEEDVSRRYASITELQTDLMRLQERLSERKG
jgi:serine/threonine protein kinase